MNKHKQLLMFLSGVCTGATSGILVLWRHLKNKSDREIEEARESLYQLMKQEVDKGVEKVFQESEEQSEEEVKEYREVVNNYIPPSQSKPSPVSYVYTITPDDYYYDREHDKEELVYYEEENVLADGDDAAIDISETVTYECLTHMGEYEEDAVYIRNENTGTDYCVTRTTEHYVNPEAPVIDDYE